jgi:molybdopterin-guanine dinucleotide biosynthesis protein A
VIAHRSNPGGAPSAGIVLAGGRSSRFGRDKLLAEFDGEPLLWRPLRALAGAGCREIVVVIGPTAPEPAVPPELGSIVHFARDPEPFGGPLVGLRAGLAATNAGRVVVVAGDQPALRPALLAAMAEALAAPGGPGLTGAVALVDPAEVTRPLPCALDRLLGLSVATRLLTAGERSLRGMLVALDTREIPEAAWRPLDPDASWTLDVDLPGDTGRYR